MKQAPRRAFGSLKLAYNPEDVDEGRDCQSPDDHRDQDTTHGHEVA
jgi:hypothetical protein